jgi:hypothetical protein
MWITASSKIHSFLKILRQQQGNCKQYSHHTLDQFSFVIFIQKKKWLQLKSNNNYKFRTSPTSSKQLHLGIQNLSLTHRVLRVPSQLLIFLKQTNYYIILLHSWLGVITITHDQVTKILSKCQRFWIPNDSQAWAVMPCVLADIIDDALTS